MEVAQDQSISVLAPPSTVPGPDDLLCANICDIMLRILEEDSSMRTPGSALKRTSLFGICSLLGDGLLSSGYQCFYFSLTLGRPFLCLSGAYLAACPYPRFILLHLPPVIPSVSPGTPPSLPSTFFGALISWAL